MGFCKQCGCFNKHLKSCRYHPSKVGGNTLTEPQKQQQDQSEKSQVDPTDVHPNQTCIRWSLLLTSSVSILIGAVLMILAATSSTAVAGKLIFGIILLCVGAIILTSWAIAAFCCEHRWCCPTC